MARVSRRRSVLALAAVVLVAASCGDDGGGAAPDRSPAIPAANAAEAPLLPTDAAALPELNLAGYEDLIGQLEGTPILVNFWGSWCPPCRAEAPDLTEAHERFGDRVQFLGVDILDSRGNARAFMEEFGWTYPSIFDPPGAIRDRLGLLGQPVTLFYDETGELVDQWSGPIPPRELTTRLQRLVPA